MMVTILDYSHQLILEDQVDFGGHTGILYTTSARRTYINNFKIMYFLKSDFYLKHFNIKDSEHLPELNIFVVNYVDNLTSSRVDGASVRDNQAKFITLCMQISPDILIYNDLKCSILDLVNVRVKIPVHRITKMIESTDAFRHIEYLVINSNIIQLDNVVTVNIGYQGNPYKFSGNFNGKNIESIDPSILHIARRKVVLDNLYIHFDSIITRKNNLQRVADIQDQILMLQRELYSLIEKI